MKIVAKVWASRDGVTFLRSTDGDVGILIDDERFERMKPVGIDVEEGDTVVIDAAIVRRTRPEGKA